MQMLEDECRDTMNLTINKVALKKVDSKLYRKHFPGITPPQRGVKDAASDIYHSLVDIKDYQTLAT